MCHNRYPHPFCGLQMTKKRYCYQYRQACRQHVYEFSRRTVKGFPEGDSWYGGRIPDTGRGSYVEVMGNSSAPGVDEVDSIFACNRESMICVKTYILKRTIYQRPSVFFLWSILVFFSCHDLPFILGVGTGSLGRLVLSLQVPQLGL